MRHHPGPRASDWILPEVSATFVLSYSLLVLLDLPVPRVRLVLITVAIGCWIVLIVSLIAHLARTPRGERLHWLSTHHDHLAAAIFPLFGAFTLLRYLDRIPGLRGNGGNAFRSRIAVRAGLYGITFVYVIALTELAVERGDPDASIRSFGEAIWWAFVTVATVGYGDYTPVTPLGRLLAIVLMAGGLVIIGTASALIVSYLGERIRHRDD
jgi:voltage-gated potassium channel